MTKRILIAGGGTGGHVYPALATIAALNERGTFEFLYVGGKNGIETRIIPKHGIAMKTIWIAGITRSLALKNLLFPAKLVASLIASWRIVGRFRPHVAVGTGGYVSGPVLFAAARRGVPVLIQEQDVHPGLTTRLLAKYARIICLAFPAAQAHFKMAGARIRVTGNPVRQDLQDVTQNAGRQRFGLSENRLTLLVFGGSQGARAINVALLNILPALLEGINFQVIWQTGDGQHTAVTGRADFDTRRVVIRPYIEKMNAAYAAADVVLCRAGALTLAELAIVGKPAVLVPYPYAAGDHQVHNARMVEDAGAAVMVQEGDRWEETLRKALENILKNGSLREQQQTAWQTLARPHAAAQIADEIIRLADAQN